MSIDDKIERFETFLKNLTLYPRFKNIRTVEMDLLGELNPINDFEEHFYAKDKYITFDKFFLYYVKKHKDLIVKTFPDYISDSFLNGLQARLYRTYMGLVTEYHAFLIAQKVFGIKNVIRDNIADKKGVDFTIKYKDKNYNIHIFIDREDAWNKRRFKSTKKHADQLDGYHVNFPYSLIPDRFNSVKRLKNGVGCYTVKYFEFLKQKIDEGKVLNNNIIGTGITDFLYSKNQSSEREQFLSPHYKTYDTPKQV
jgi:hypothetical protein